MLLTVTINTLLAVVDTLRSLILRLRRLFCPSAEKTVPLAPHPSLEVSPPPLLPSPRDRVLKFKSSQDVIGQWSKEVGIGMIKT